MARIMSFLSMNFISSALQDWAAGATAQDGTRTTMAATTAGNNIQLGISLGPPQHGGGASLARIKPGSPAWLAKLQPGDELVRVAGVDVSSSSHSVKETLDLVSEMWARSEMDSEGDIGKVVNLSASIPHEVDGIGAGCPPELRVGVRDCRWAAKIRGTSAFSAMDPFDVNPPSCVHSNHALHQSRDVFFGKLLH